MILKTSSFLVLAAFVFLTGCNTKTPSETLNGGTATTDKATTDKANVEAPLTDLPPDSIAHVVEAHNKEGKAVLINVWATWCGPCVEEFPDIVALREKYKDQLEVVFISADFEEDRERAVTFLKEQNVNWETYFKTGKDVPFILALSESWTGALPFSKVYNKKGEVVDRWENKASYETFEQTIQKAIQ